jgi:hypothetical protein
MLGVPEAFGSHPEHILGRPKGQCNTSWSNESWMFDSSFLDKQVQSDLRRMQ